MGFERVYLTVVHWVEVRGCHSGRRMACPKVGTMENLDDTVEKWIELNTNAMWSVL